MHDAATHLNIWPAVVADDNGAGAGSLLPHVRRWGKAESCSVKTAREVTVGSAVGRRNRSEGNEQAVQGGGQDSSKTGAEGGIVQEQCAKGTDVLYTMSHQIRCTVHKYGEVDHVVHVCPFFIRGCCPQITQDFKRRRDELEDLAVQERDEILQRAEQPCRVGAQCRSKRSSQGRHFFDGDICHVAAYCTALTSDDISEHFSAGSRVASPNSRRLYDLASAKFADALGQAPDDKETLTRYGQSLVRYIETASMQVKHLSWADCLRIHIVNAMSASRLCPLAPPSMNRRCLAWREKLPSFNTEHL